MEGKERETDRWTDRGGGGGRVYLDRQINSTKAFSLDSTVQEMRGYDYRKNIDSQMI